MYTLCSSSNRLQIKFYTVTRENLNCDDWPLTGFCWSKKTSQPTFVCWSGALFQSALASNKQRTTVSQPKCTALTSKWGSQCRWWDETMGVQLRIVVLLDEVGGGPKNTIHFVEQLPEVEKKLVVVTSTDFQNLLRDLNEAPLLVVVFLFKLFISFNGIIPNPTNHLTDIVWKHRSRAAFFPLHDWKKRANCQHKSSVSFKNFEEIFKKAQNSEIREI